MSVKSIREYHAKKILQSNFSTDLGIQGVLVDPKVPAAPARRRHTSGTAHNTSQNAPTTLPDCKVLDETEGTSWKSIVEENPWLLTTQLVAKPDQLVKRRGKLGLITVNKSFDQAKECARRYRGSMMGSERCCIRWTRIALVTADSENALGASRRHCSQVDYGEDAEDY